MRVLRNRFLLFGGILYVIYLAIYLLLQRPLPGQIEIRAWVSVFLLSIAIAGGLFWFLSLIRIITGKFISIGWKQYVVKGLAVICSIIVIGSAVIFGRIFISEIPDETMSTKGILLVSVQESKDSMRLYYCEEVNIFLRRKLSAEEFRQTQR